MKIIVGHSNMDLDCLGSMVIARKLFPDHNLVKSRHVHPVARNLFNLYQNHLGCLHTQDLKGKRVESMIVVDTRSRNRIKEFIDVMEYPPDTIEVYDHHPGDSRDIEGANIHDSTAGANTSFLGMMLIEKGISLGPEDATIALTGIYADTGNFTHDNVQNIDFEVAQYLMNCGASLKLVRKFTSTLKERYQITLFHDVLNNLMHRDIHGHRVIISYMELPQQVQGVAAVVEKVFEVEDADAIFSIFYFEKQDDVLIVARSSKDTIPVNQLLEGFGGGGHTKASSALIKDTQGTHILNVLEKYLDSSLVSAVKVSELMEPEVYTIPETWTLMKTSIYLEEIEHTGAPVVNEKEELVGFLTLRDIMKGRKSNQMHAPVKGYMSRKVIAASINSTVRDIENLFYTHNIGHLPVVGGGKVLGIITRWDYLNHLKKRSIKRADR
jgi:tRNA nucleotidyltransferase (CCA-adding enzyme)